MIEIGDRNVFAIAIGDYWVSSNASRHIQTFVAGTCITPGDDCAYVSTFVGYLEREIERIEKLDLRRPGLDGFDDIELIDELFGSSHEVLNYDVSCKRGVAVLVSTSDYCRLIFRFWEGNDDVPVDDRNRLVSVEVDKREFLSVLRDALEHLQRE